MNWKSNLLLAQLKSASLTKKALSIVMLMSVQSQFVLSQEMALKSQNLSFITAQYFKILAIWRRIPELTGQSRLPGRHGRLERGKPFIEFLIAGLSTNRKRVFRSRDLSRPIRARDSWRDQSQRRSSEMLAAEKLSCGPEVLYHQRI